MKEPLPSSESLTIAWESIGRKPDARRLFDEAGFAADHIVQFYEMLRASPEILTAFRKGTRESKLRQKPTSQAKEREHHPEGRFRLVDLWLEEFKTLTTTPCFSILPKALMLSSDGMAQASPICLKHS